MGMLIAAGVGLAAGYLLKTGYDLAPARPVQPSRPAAHTSSRPAPQSERTASVRCSDPDGTIHGWQGNGTGVTPHDWLHFLPPCNEGGRR
jgi:hypothetical protein